MHRSGLAVCAGAVVAVLLVGLCSAPAQARDETPPPFPTIEERERFISAEREAFTKFAAPYEPRAIHDEYDVIHYDVTLGVDIPDTLHGIVEVEAVANVPNLSQIDIDLYPCLRADSVFAGDAPTSYVHNNQILTITLDDTYQIGETFVVRCHYHGRPTFTGAPFRFSSHDGVPMILSYSEPYGAPAWWMCDDDPKDKATLDLHFTVPDTLIVVSNGTLTSVVDDTSNTKTYTWETDYQMSPYLFSIAVTNYQSWTEMYYGIDPADSMTVYYYAYPEDFADAQVSWSRNVEMMEYYRTLFGEYPFLQEKYAIAEFHHPGAMEHQTATSMGYSWITGTHANDYVVAHELSHSWVGDMITMTTWPHAWTKEGFGTYCEALWFEHLYGENTYHGYMRAMNVLNYAIHQLYNIQPPLHSAIYYKGAWVLHMLRHVIGPDDFFDGVYAYTNDSTFMYNVADTEDMREVFESVSGMDLVWFFQEWIYSPGYPIYAYDWSAVPVASGYDVSLDIHQIQTVGPIFKMPIDIEIETDLGDELFVVWDSLQAQSFVLHVEGVPLDVTLDPDEWIIKVAQLTGVEGVADAGVLLLDQNRPNPFNPRTVISYDLATDGPARLVIYDLAGRAVKRLVDGWQPAGPGTAVWDGRNALGQPASAGVYFYRLDADGRSSSRRMVLVR